MIIRVTGRVQGVAYRANAKRCADELGIKGSVRNLEDGSVYIEAEGSESNLTQFLAWCEKGPRAAVVEKIEVKNADPKGYPDFRIER